MSDAETRNLAELKKDIEERIAEAEKDLILLKTSLKLVDEALAKVSFQPASKLVERKESVPVAAEPALRTRMEPRVVDETRPFREAQPVAPAPTVPAPSVAEEQAFPIKSKMGEDLGVFYVGRNQIRIVPHAGLSFSIKTPPFQSFFVDRVIGEMHRKDEMAVDAGAKDPSSMIEHEIKLDGDAIREIIVRNIEEEARIRELRSSIRWTLERMMEKTPRT
ncbi:MAG: hypothetical protein ABSF36_00220 [Candidatus Methanomethylicaceae archaeon]